MSSISISDLRPAGSELFNDSESYVRELSDEELGIIQGGATPLLIVTLSGVIGFTLNHIGAKPVR